MTRPPLHFFVSFLSCLAAAPTQPTTKPATLPTTQPVHFTLTAGSPLHLQSEGVLRRWNFGDSTDAARFNDLTGYNAAHLYHRPGDYTVTESDPGGKNPESQTVRVVPDTSPIIQVPDNKLAEAIASAPANARLRLARGSTHDLTRTLYLKRSLKISAASGDGPLPRIRVTSGSNTYAFYVLAAAHLSLTDLEFDSDQPWNSFPTKIGRHALYLAQGSATVLRCTFRNLDNAIQGSPGADRVLVQDCRFTDEIRSCDVWVHGTRYVILGCTAGDSRFEHNVRSSEPDVAYVLVAGCTFSNPPVLAKETLTFRDGEYLCAWGNTLRAGRLQVSQGRPHDHDLCRHVTVAHNTLDAGAFLQINPGCQDVRAFSNRIIDSGNKTIDAIRVCAPSDDIQIFDNLWQTPSPTARPVVRLFGAPTHLFRSNNRTELLPPTSRSTTQP